MLSTHKICPSNIATAAHLCHRSLLTIFNNSPFTEAKPPPPPLLEMCYLNLPLFQGTPPSPIPVSCFEQLYSVQYFFLCSKNNIHTSQVGLGRGSRIVCLTSPGAETSRPLTWSAPSTAGLTKIPVGVKRQFSTTIKPRAEQTQIHKRRFTPRSRRLAIGPFLL